MPAFDRRAGRTAGAAAAGGSVRRLGRRVGARGPGAACRRGAADADDRQCRSAVGAAPGRRDCRGSRRSLRVALLPDWETLPYDHFSPHQDLVSERLATLYRIDARRVRRRWSSRPRPRSTASRRRPISRRSPSSSSRASTLDVDALRAQLALAGYAHVTQVVSPGRVQRPRRPDRPVSDGHARCPTASISSTTRSRSIRTFDVDTQRTLYPVHEVRLLPAREFPLDDAGPHALSQPLSRVVRRRPVEVARCTRTCRNGIAPGGIEYYLPLFFEATAHARRLPARRTRWSRCTATSRGAIERFWQDTESRYRLLRGDKARPLLPPTELFLPPDAFYGALKPFGALETARQRRATVPPHAAAAGAGRPARRRSAGAR